MKEMNFKLFLTSVKEKRRDSERRCRSCSRKLVYFRRKTISQERCRMTEISIRDLQMRMMRTPAQSDKRRKARRIVLLIWCYLIELVRL